VVPPDVQVTRGVTRRPSGHRAGDDTLEKRPGA
jgi:hypothetical protein